jgi:hypothetical protein
MRVWFAVVSNYSIGATGWVDGTHPMPGTSVGETLAQRAVSCDRLPPDFDEKQAEEALTARVREAGWVEDWGKWLEGEIEAITSSV